MRLKMYWIYLVMAKPFLKIGNWFYNKHVASLRAQQVKEGTRRL